MSELVLTRDERLALRARAHHLNPVVLLGAAGLTDAVVGETDRALTAHELIKVRIPGDDRNGREAIGLQLADRLGAARVQSIGKLVVLYRPRPDEDASDRAAGGPAPKARKAPPVAAPRPTRARPRSAGAPARALPRRGSGRGR